MNTTPLVGLFAALVSLGALFVWIGLFSREERPIYRSDITETQTLSFWERIKARYELMEPPLTFNAYLLINVILAIGLFVGFTVLLNLIILGLVAAAFVPLVSWQLINNRYMDVLIERQKEFAAFADDYARLLFLRGSPQLANVLVAKAGGYFGNLMTRFNDLVAGGKSVREAAIEAEKFSDLPYWYQFLELVVTAEERGGKMASAFEELGNAMRDNAILLDRIFTEIRQMIRSSNVVLVMYFILSAIIANTEIGRPILSTPLGLVGQAVSSILAVVAWFLTRRVAIAGLLLAQSDRTRFAREEIEALRQQTAKPIAATDTPSALIEIMRETSAS